MPTLIEKPTEVVAVGTKPKLIEEFVGQVNSKTAGAQCRAHEKSRGMVGAGTNAGV